MPVFTIVSCNFSDNIPFPMWEGDEDRGGSLLSWDENMKAYANDPYPQWAMKENKAVFRGGLRQSSYFEDRAIAEHHCSEVGRSKLVLLQKQTPDLFNVSVNGVCGGESMALNHLRPQDHVSFPTSKPAMRNGTYFQLFPTFLFFYSCSADDLGLFILNL